MWYVVFTASNTNDHVHAGVKLTVRCDVININSFENENSHKSLGCCQFVAFLRKQCINYSFLFDIYV